MDWIIYTIISLLFIFCLFVFYRVGYIKGLKTGHEIGVRMMLKEWKESMGDHN